MRAFTVQGLRQYCCGLFRRRSPMPCGPIAKSVQEAVIYIGKDKFRHHTLHSGHSGSASLFYTEPEASTPARTLVTLPSRVAAGSTQVLVWLSAVDCGFDYQNRKQDYVNRFVQFLDWDEINRRYQFLRGM